LNPLSVTTFHGLSIRRSRALKTLKNSPKRAFTVVPFFLLDVSGEVATFTPLPYQVVEVVKTTISCDSMQMELPFSFITFLRNLTE
jgi:hypothetical protein